MEIAYASVFGYAMYTHLADVNDITKSNLVRVTLV